MAQAKPNRLTDTQKNQHMENMAQINSKFQDKLSSFELAPNSNSNQQSESRKPQLNMPLLDQKKDQVSERRLVEDYLENHQIEEFQQAY